MTGSRDCEPDDPTCAEEDHHNGSELGTRGLKRPREDNAMDGTGAAADEMVGTQEAAPAAKEPGQEGGVQEPMVSHGAKRQRHPDLVEKGVQTSEGDPSSACEAAADGKESAAQEAAREPDLKQEWGRLVAPFAQKPSCVSLRGRKFVIGSNRSGAGKGGWSAPPGKQAATQLCRIAYDPAKPKSTAVSIEALTDRALITVNGFNAKRGDKVPIRPGFEIKISAVRYLANPSGSLSFIYVPIEEFLGHEAAEPKTAAAGGAGAGEAGTSQQPEQPPDRSGEAQPKDCTMSDAEAQTAAEPAEQPGEAEGPRPDAEGEAPADGDEDEGRKGKLASAREKFRKMDSGSLEGAEECDLTLKDEEDPLEQPAEDEATLPDPADEEALEDQYEAQAAAETLQDSPQRVQFREKFRKMTTGPDALGGGLDKLPYYLSDSGRRQLMFTGLLHLSAPEAERAHLQSAMDLPSLSSRILLVGPKGASLYLQSVASALAAQHKASLLVFDRSELKLEEEDDTAAGASRRRRPARTWSPGPAREDDSGDDYVFFDGEKDDSLDDGSDGDEWYSRSKRLTGCYLDVIKARKASKALHGAAAGSSGLARLQSSRKPPASREAKSGSGTDGEQASLRKGDRVRFVGHGGAAAGGGRGFGPMAALVLWGGAKHGVASPRQIRSSGSSSAGPFPNCPGRVVLAFDSKPGKVGIRFDYAIPGGTNLGGLCEDRHGYWCSTRELRREGSCKAEEAETACVDALFDVAAEVAAEGPLVILLKDLGKTVMGNVERFLHFKRKISRLPKNALLVGVHTTSELSRDRGYSAVFARLGGGASSSGPALFDVNFFDPLRSAEGDRAARPLRAEQSSVTRFLQRLLPNKIILHGPQDEPAAAEWKKAMERDSATLRESANRQLLASVAAKFKLEIPEEQLRKIDCGEEQLTPETAEKVLGWAVCAHLQSAMAAPLGGEAHRRGRGSGAAGSSEPADGAAPSGEEAAAAAAEAEASRAEPADCEAPTEAPEGSGGGGLETEQVAEGAADAEAPAKEQGGEKQAVALEAASVQAGLSLLKDTLAEASSAQSPEESKPNSSLKDVQTDNEFEKRLLSEVIPAAEVGVRFEDIGALDSVKATLQEVVMLPLQRPELFRRGSLTKPTRGVLLFGPPGTGKTMLAKAVASESGANFINVSMASLASKWFGEGEKYVRALFTLAHKIAPSVVFVDEVDSMLGRRDKHGEHEAMRKIKNEFMSHWDGLKTREKDRVLVLAATNRPYDLDEAVIRRMPRRLMVDLPDTENRVKILKVILKDEELEGGFDYEALAGVTEGYSGSDLRNLCVTAAFQPIRDYLQEEKKRKREAEAEGGPSPGQDAPAEVKLRPLTLADVMAARDSVCASVSGDTQSMSELRQWNEMYGEGGSRRRDTLSY
eukprot:CAMPEP_0177609912 /NCGR_PEP_ID=MMETSP0419_2-20121207/19416_1 /TAXON_ID=582737 /ORGANISM="Tetraselmis sp., Strain GSL018" /LENGTH=1403 /DNA_ID=CAMNT_0019105017 /DNA_START=319 /DNA_END=4527 /DNA_ORIENTATION=+